MSTGIYGDQLGFGNNKGYRIYELNGIPTTGDQVLLATIYVTDGNYPYDNAQPETEYWILADASGADMEAGFVLELQEENGHTQLPFDPDTGDGVAVPKKDVVTVGTGYQSPENGTGCFRNESDTGANMAALQLIMSKPLDKDSTIATVRFFFKDKDKPMSFIPTKEMSSYRFDKSRSPNASWCYFDETPLS